jgi:hypothetical protein
MTTSKQKPNWSWQKGVAICILIQATHVLLFDRRILGSARLIAIELARAVFVALGLILAGKALTKVLKARRNQ